MRSTSLTLSLLGAAAVADAWRHFALMDSFNWRKPHPEDHIPWNHKIECRADKTFHANEHKLTEIVKDAKAGIEPWTEAATFFTENPYPGYWLGVDEGVADRAVIVMEYKDVPEAVKNWIKEQEGKEDGKKGLFAIYRKPKTEGGKKKKAEESASEKVVSMEDIPDKDKIMMFAGAAIHENLPLWVAKGSKCEDKFMDLSLYSSEPKDGGVVAWPVEHTHPKDPKHGKTSVTFKIDAQLLSESEEARLVRERWERAYIGIQRQERKYKKQEMERIKKEIEYEKRLADRNEL